MIGHIWTRLTYGNVVATLAMFIALSGTSYALSLPRNSVSSRELRPRSVGASELKTGAVAARDIRNGAVSLSDISLGARASLRGQRGPVGPPGPSGLTFFAVADAGGGIVAGSDAHSDQRGVNGRLIRFSRSLDACSSSATLARVPGSAVDPAPGSTITVAAQEGGVLVRTWDQNHEEKGLPFHLIVAC